MAPYNWGSSGSQQMSIGIFNIHFHCPGIMSWRLLYFPSLIIVQFEYIAVKATPIQIPGFPVTLFLKYIPAFSRLMCVASSAGNNLLTIVLCGLTV